MWQNSPFFAYFRGLHVLSGLSFCGKCGFKTFIFSRDGKPARSGRNLEQFSNLEVSAKRLIRCQSMICLEAEHSGVKLPSFVSRLPLLSPSCRTPNSRVCSQVGEMMHGSFLFFVCVFRFVAFWHEFIFPSSCQCCDRGFVLYFFFLCIELCVVIFVSLPGSEHVKVRPYKGVVVSPRLHAKKKKKLSPRRPIIPIQWFMCTSL